MRATSLPPAPTVATAAIPLIAAVLALLAVPSAAPAERWLRPVPGEVARSFSYVRAAPFARGAHRGADLAAAPGTTVRSACAGTVVHAGPVVRQGRVVSVRCGTRRVSYLPLASLTVRAGSTIGAGSPLGTVAVGHGGLHVGVRRERDRFGYEDPMRLIAPAPPASAPPLPVVRARPRAPVRRPAPPLRRFRPRATVPRSPAPRPAAPPRRVRPRVTVPRSAPGRPVSPRLEAPRRRPAGSPLDVPRPLAPRTSSPPSVAPWPVWAGLVMLLAGAAGSSAVLVHRRRARRAAPTGAVAPRAS